MRFVSGDCLQETNEKKLFVDELFLRPISFMEIGAFDELFVDSSLR